MPVTLSISQRNGASYSGLSHSYMHSLLHTSSLTLCVTTQASPIIVALILALATKKKCRRKTPQLGRVLEDVP